MTQLQKVSLSFACNPCDGLSIDANGAQEILKQISYRPSVTALGLQGNKLLKPAVPLLCNFIRNNRNLRFLDLSQCELGDENAESLVQATNTSLKGSVCRLSTLILSYNNLSDRVCDAIGKIAHSTSLRRVTLACNPITKEGLFKLVRLNSATKLQEIDLRYTGIEPCDAVTSHLVKTLPTCPSLMLLQLDGNKFTKSEFNALRSLGERVTVGRAAGNLPALERAVQKQRDTHYPPKEEEKEKKSDSEPEPEPEPADVVSDIAKIFGAIVCVRRNAPQSSRSKALKLLEVAPAATRPVSSRSNSVAADRSIPVARRPSRCDAAPRLSQPAAPPPGEEPSDWDEEPFVTPQQPPVLDNRASSRGRSRSVESSRVESRSSSVVSGPTSARGQRQEDATVKSQVRKGRLARLLLEKASADDGQALRILNLNETHLLAAGGGSEIDLPVELQRVSGVPSELHAFPLHSVERIQGLAKLLFCIIYAPGERILLETAVAMKSLPLMVQSFPLEEQGRYRSSRSVENNAARRYLASLLGLARDGDDEPFPQQPTPRRSNSRTPRGYSHVKSRYLNVA